MSRKLALIIGNSEYEDANLKKLVAPDADVHALAQVLRDPEVGKFDEVLELVNQTSTAIRRAISSFFVGRQRDDLLLLYFSGHGIKDDRGQLFLGVKDTEHNLLRGTAIPAAFITEEMDNSRSRQQILILDCCHSGAFSRGIKAMTGASVGTAAAFEGTGSGRVVLTASDSTQYAWEGDQVLGQAKNSVFTHYLVKGLGTGEADTDADGRITLDEMYDYVYEQVVHETPLQTPSKWSYGQQGEIVIAKNPHPISKPAELSSDLQQTIEDPRPWVREGAVRELDRILQGTNQGLALSAYSALKQLANDDSRRVAMLASDTLAPYEKTQGLPQENEATEIERLEVERRAAQNAEKEAAEQQKSKEKDQDRFASDKVSTPVNQQELAAMKKSYEEALVQDIVKQPLPTPTSTVVPGEIGSSSSSSATKFMYWKQVLMVAVGWGIAGTSMMILNRMRVGTLVGENSADAALFARLIGPIAGAIGGVITGLALWWRQGFIGWKQLITITIGWSIAGIMAPGIFFSYRGYIHWIFPEVVTIWLLQNNAVTTGAVFGVIGGVVTGLALWWSERSMQWKQLLIIITGWIFGGTLLWVLFPFAGITLLGNAVLAGVVCGTIGGSVMFWQLDQAKANNKRARQG